MSRSALLLSCLTALLFSFGLLMVFNTTSAEILDRELAISPQHALIKQITFALFGLVLIWVIWHLGVERLFDLAPLLFKGGIVILLLVLIPGIGQKINGARRWIGFGFMSFQPSEFMKIIIPLYAIGFINRCETFTFSLFLRLIWHVSIPIALILFEPDNGTTAMLLAILCALFFVCKVSWKYWALPLFCLTLIGGGIGSQMSHVSDRLRIYLNPELDLLGKGHQPYQAKIAAGSGRLWGRGLGESLQKLNYLPEARSDYIAAIFAEEFGFVGINCLILVYMSFAYFGIRSASESASERIGQLAALLTFSIAIQGFINLGVVSGLLPSKGTNLPFFSQGGSSLLSNMAALGIILRSSCSRYVTLD